MFSRWCNSSANPQKKKSRCATVIAVKETTRGSARKTYYYNAERIVLRGSKKKGVKKGKKTIKYKYTNSLHSSKA